MVWLELRVTQGHRFDPEEESEVAAVIENTTDVPPRRVFCESENNFLFCYIHLRDDRIPIGRLQFLHSELRRAERDWIARSIDELNVVDEAVVFENIPEAVGVGIRG